MEKVLLNTQVLTNTYDYKRERGKTNNKYKNKQKNILIYMQIRNIYIQKYICTYPLSIVNDREREKETNKSNEHIKLLQKNSDAGE